MILFLRSLLFNVAVSIFTFGYAFLLLFTYPLSFKSRYKYIRLFSKVVAWLARVICNIHYSVEGKNNLPKENCIILSNHQSTWETFTFQLIFPMHTWVIKKEILKIPIVGWAAALFRPIAIDRKAGDTAVNQLLEQGEARLNEGCWIIIFPEGTRVPVNKNKRFARGGSLLAKKTGRKVIPVAHNAGYYWPRRTFIKKPGMIQVKIGPPIDVKDRDAIEINRLAKEWVDNALETMRPSEK